MLQKIPNIHFSSKSLLFVLKTFLILIGLISIVSNEVYAQSDYVVTLKGDTIQGKLVLHLRSGVLQTASLKTEDEKLTFQVYELLGAGKEDSTIYHTKKILGKYQFAQLVKEGYLSYYLYSEEELQSQKFTLQVLIKRDGEAQTFSNIVFKKRVSTFLDDCATVKLNFENNVYKRNDLFRIIDEYNECIERQTNNQLTLNSLEDVQLDQDKLSQFQKLEKAVNQSTALDNKNEILDMLDDVEQKLKSGQDIPGYLKEALKNNLESHPDLLALLETII